MRSYITEKDFKNNNGYFIHENIVGDFFKGEKVENTIVFTTNHLSAPRIAYCFFENTFIFDLGIKDITEFVKKNFPDDFELSEEEKQKILFKQSVKKDYMIKHINFIENGSKVVVHPDGTFDVTEYPLKPYSIELEDAYDNLHKLYLKYKKGIEKAIKENRFIPTLTGGVDTRSLSALGRDYVNNPIDSYYARDVKSDGKDNVEIGLADAECGKRVADRLGLKYHLTELPKNAITLCGMYTESARSAISSMNKYFNDPNFIYKYIQHQPRSERLLCIYADDLFLEIKQPRFDVFRCLTTLLFCPDLLDIGFTGLGTHGVRNGRQPKSFEQEFDGCMDSAKEILDHGGPEKCKNILKED